MGKIFISYRRDDTEYISGYISEQLMRIFGKDNVFIDVDTIQGGVDYRVAIGNAIAETSMMLVVIGPHWIHMQDAAGGRRLDQPNDPVRLEIETALQRNIPILPLLVQQASVPAEKELPASLARLTYQHALPVRSGRDFQHDMDLVIANIARLVPRVDGAPTSAPIPSQPLPYSQPYVFAQTPPAALKPSGNGAGGGARVAVIVMIIAVVALVVVAAIKLVPVNAHPPLTGSNDTSSLGQATGPTATSAPTTAAQLPPPTLNIQPSDYFLQCPFDAYGHATGRGPSNVVTLDNTDNRVSIDWTTSISDNDPAGKVWGSASPASGTIGAGQQGKVTISPGPSFCHDLEATKLGDYHVKVTYRITGQTITSDATITAHAGI